MLRTENNSDIQEEETTKDELSDKICAVDQNQERNCYELINMKSEIEVKEEHLTTEEDVTSMKEEHLTTEEDVTSNFDDKITSHGGGICFN
ncbi:hypothetical protein Avbf_04241 [Armadillidium vulgare]|nr:hypothetical protein Avbf_04241 [Armadillidium vulgare]